MIVIDKSVLERTSTDAVVSGIWMRFKDGAFPRQGWDDFAAVILACLAEALVRLSQGDSTFESVPFLEGPKRVELALVDDSRLMLRAVDNEHQRLVEHEAEVTLQAFGSAVVSAGDQLLAWCGERGWWSSDEITLARKIEELRRYL